MKEQDKIEIDVLQLVKVLWKRKIPHRLSCASSRRNSVCL